MWVQRLVMVPLRCLVVLIMVLTPECCSQLYTNNHLAVTSSSSHRHEETSPTIEGVSVSMSEKSGIVDSPKLLLHHGEGGNFEEEQRQWDIEHGQIAALVIAPSLAPSWNAPTLTLPPILTSHPQIAFVMKVHSATSMVSFHLKRPLCATSLSTHIDQLHSGRYDKCATNIVLNNLHEVRTSSFVKSL